MTVLGVTTLCGAAWLLYAATRLLDAAARRCRTTRSERVAASPSATHIALSEMYVLGADA